jgi:hypothetical protein
MLNDEIINTHKFCMKDIFSFIEFTSIVIVQKSEVMSFPIA